MTKIDRINGAIVGLGLLYDDIEILLKDKNRSSIMISTCQLKDKIKNKISTFKNIKIKELEKTLKLKNE